MNRSILGIAIVSVLASGCAGASGDEAGQAASDLRIRAAGAVYALTNEAGANAVLVYHRADDGTLTPSATVLTGGRGSGDGLGSQGALALSANGRWLFAVNAGSNEVSSFRVTGDALALVSVAPSGGARPVSVALHDHLLYVLNASGAGSISGLAVGRDGDLTPLPGSTRPLSGAADAGPAEVQFDPDGDTLVVTEKNTNRIDTYAVRWNGLASAPRVAPAAGVTPFGFAFNERGVMVVAEAAGGAPGMGTASSYRLTSRSLPDVVSAAVHDGQGAPCWVAIPSGGATAYVANTGSGDISAFRIDRRGGLTLEGDGVAAVTGEGSKPADLAITPDDRFLYVLNGGNGTVGAFRVNGRGGLASVGIVAGLPAHPAGLVAR